MSFQPNPSAHHGDLATIPALPCTSTGPTYWQGLDELAESPEFLEFLHREFPAGAAEWPNRSSRRHWLHLMGASFALAGLSACTRQPLERIVPYVNQPENVLPGTPLSFATAMTLGGFATGLLVQSHDGRPTKIEGNPDHPTSLGATNVFHQASLLDLYDPDRSQAILENSQITSWESFLGSIHLAMQAQHARHGAGLRILTETVTSPTLHAQLQTLSRRFPEAHWHQFEPVNRDNLRAGAELAFGQILEPAYHFHKAHVILSLDSDFLYAHPAALRHTRQFIDQRRIISRQNEMNRLYVVEPSPSVTGSMADHRLPLPSHLIEPFTRALIAHFGIAADTAPDPGLQPHLPWIAAVADNLRLHPGASIIITGDRQPPIVHALAHVLNQLLNNVGHAVTYSPSAEALPVQQNDSLRHLVEALDGGSVDFLLILGGNPVFNAPVNLDFAQHLDKARLSVHLSPDVNETSVRCHWHIPQSHYLESWSDARSVDGTVSLVQPLILPLHGGRSPHELLDALLQQPTRSDYNIVRAHWNSQSDAPDFEKRWRRALHDGFIPHTASPQVTPSLREFDPTSRTDTIHPGIEINFAPDPTLWDGRFANNGWLQELPKPLTKITWDNAALVSPATARERNLSNGTMVEIEFHHRKFLSPVWITPGQADDTLTLHVGGGRSRVGRVGRRVGFNTYSIRPSDAFWFAQGITLNPTNARHPLAVTQRHHRIDSEERQILREGTLDQFHANPAFIQDSTKTPDPDHTLYNPEIHRSDGYQWGMSIDLGACIGCNACVLACQAENNIPIVGKTQVAKGREMQWIRIDTYFSGSPAQPDVIHQPVPCMHCEHAPCELVCPVAATVHDQEGLNVQVYNRCIGTRYCSNNCPYKVRRFNFLSYVDPNPVLQLLRNPNVTVRSRGVMEKCTYCVQRISAARIEAKKINRPIRDGELQTACQQVCPAEAISFGDVSNPDSRVSALKASPLNFSMLGELNTRPRTTYLARLRNPYPALQHHPPKEARAPIPPRANPPSPPHA